jgi:hypothetical protein
MPDDLDQTARYFGQSLFRFEPPDLVFVVGVGEMTPAAISALYDEVDRLVAGKDHLFSIADIRRSAVGSPEVRRIALARGQLFPFRGTAIIGASGPVGAVASLLFRAFGVLKPAVKDSPVRFFDTEEEARAWIAERRRAVERQGAH